MVWAEPAPEARALAAYYADEYRAAGRYGAAAVDLREFPRDNGFFFARGQSIAELVERHARGRVEGALDIGAGFGHLLHALGERFPGASRTAVELSGACRAHLEGLGIRVVARPVEEALKEVLEEETRYDLVTASHVVEHLLAPRRVLEAVRNRLTESGLLYVEVPHIPRGSLRRYPDHLLAPRHDEPHVTFYHPEALRALLGRSGYEVEFLDTAGPRYRYVSALAYRLPQWRWLADRVVPRRLLQAAGRLPGMRRARFDAGANEFTAYGGDRIWLRAVARKKI